MSNYLAIAAVTMTLRKILQVAFSSDSVLGNTDVTVLPLDRPRTGLVTNQLNLFLYMVARNGAWVNADMPRQVKPGESAFSPLPLNLYFLITAFVPDDAEQTQSHEVIGKAMSVLYDHPVLSATDILDATGTLPQNLSQQIDRVRITLHPLSIDELSKLWTGFSTQFRLSAAYEVGVTLLESSRTSPAPMPVLMRGPKDQGVPAQGDLTPPLPALSTIVAPNQQPSARLGDALTLTGVHLDGATMVHFMHRLSGVPNGVSPQAVTGTSLTMQLPPAPLKGTWPAGFYSVEVVVQRSGETFTRTTNQLMLALAPSLLTFGAAAATPRPGQIAFAVTVAPEVLPGQRATLVLGDVEFLADPVAGTPTGSLTFWGPPLAPGSYFARLRVDGVDSQYIDRSQKPPAFDLTQQVTV
jgi:uncharacterized protein DUF4255